MKITNRGVHIEDIGTEGVTSITSSEDGITIRLAIGDGVSWTWSGQEARNLMKALQAAVGVSDTGPWPALYLIPQQVTTVWDRDGEKTYRSDLSVGGSGWNNQDGYGPYTLTKD